MNWQKIAENDIKKTFTCTCMYIINDDQCFVSVINPILNKALKLKWVILTDMLCINRHVNIQRIPDSEKWLTVLDSPVWASL